MQQATPPSARRVIDVDGLQALIEALRRRGQRIIGPTISGGAIIYDEIDGLADLPRGFTDEQEPGRYALQRRDDDALFGYAVGPQSWKRFLHVPSLRLWRAKRLENEVTIEATAPESEK